MAGGEAKVCLGAVAGAHGVRGEVRIKPFTERPDGVAAYGPVETEDGRVFAIRVTKPVKGGVAARLEGVASREAAAALKGQRLYVPRARLGEPEADEDGEEAWYHADLIGCAVVGEDGTEIGTVQAVHDFGAGDLLEVLRADARGSGVPRAGARGSVLVPFTRAECPKVDIAARRIVCVPPAGLLDEDEEGGDDAEREAEDG